MRTRSRSRVAASMGRAVGAIGNRTDRTTRTTTQAHRRIVGLCFISSRLLKKDTECFEGLSMNGIVLIISNLSPFVLSPSKDSQRVFQQSANCFCSSTASDFYAAGAWTSSLRTPSGQPARIHAYASLGPLHAAARTRSIVNGLPALLTRPL